MAMITTKLSDTRLELFCLIWLHDNPTETRDTEQKLRAIINYFIKFKDVHSCRKYIENESQNNRIILITSGRLGSEIVPQIYKLRQVVSIYVYCMDKERNKKWADKFPKIKAVVVNSNELISCIKSNHKIQKIIEEPLSINIFNTERSTGDVKGHFIFFQVLIDCLLRLKSTDHDTRELLNICKEQYTDNIEEIEKIHQFQREYSPDDALWWYTYDSFFYKTLNAALRNQDIHLMFLFRGYICDIQRQLQKNQIQMNTKVYRGQLISTDELRSLERCSGQLISINSFFSTSTDYKQALIFFNNSNTNTNNLVPVLFEIDADPAMASTKPFANIQSFSNYPDESEILFMIGSIFRLKNIEHNRKTNIRTIQMILCSENDLELQQVFIRMKKQLGSGQTDLRILSRLLADMGQRTLAEKYLVRVLDQLSPTHPSRIDLYKELALLASQDGNLNKSMQWHQKIVDFEKQQAANKNSLTIQNEKKLDRLPSPYKPDNDNNRCHTCGKTFEAGGSRFTNNGLSYHEHCFRCDSCFQPMGTKRYVRQETKHYCMECYEQKIASRCVGCHQIIKQKSTVYKNQTWHPECFTCAHCKIPITAKTFPTYHDQPYCDYCHEQLFAKKCYACFKPITGPENMRYATFENHDWHIDCFRCQRCRTLLDGRRFCKFGLSIVCVDCSKS